MTLDLSIDTLHAARDSGYAVAGVNIYNLDVASAVVTAAEQENRPVLLQTGSSALRWAGTAALQAVALAVARTCSAQVGVHLDHSRDLDEIYDCLKAGYTSVMIDGSHLPFEDNIALTRRAVELGQYHGAWVEAELGAVAGSEDCSTAAGAGATTDPDQAREFVERTGADALAVAIGNVHGMASAPPRLNLDLLEAIAAVVPVPLVMHGASGVDAETIASSVDRGVAKVNINTEVRRAYVGALRSSLGASPGDDLPGLFDPARAAAVNTVRNAIRTLPESH